MINNLQIKNFKGWKDTGNIKLAPLTVLFGANSSGKSSIGQFLMLLKQSVESSDRKSVFFTGNEDTAVDLGLPSDLVFNRNKKNEISFSYDWSLEKELKIEDSLHEKKYLADRIRFSSNVKIAEDEGQNAEVREFEYRLWDARRNRDIVVGLRKKEKNGN